MYRNSQFQHSLNASDSRRMLEKGKRRRGEEEREEQKKKRKRNKEEEEEKEKEKLRKSSRRINTDPEESNSGGALQKRKKRWKKLRVPKEVWNYLEEGVPLLFQGRQRPKPRIIKTIKAGSEAEKKLGEYVQEQLCIAILKKERLSRLGPNMMWLSCTKRFCFHLLSLPAFISEICRSQELGLFCVVLFFCFSLFPFFYSVLFEWYGAPVSRTLKLLPNK